MTPSATSPPVVHRAPTAHVDSLDPSTGEIIGRFESVLPSQVPERLGRAKLAHADWSGRSVAERCDFLRKLRGVVFDRRQEIAEVISRETGKPRVEAIFAEIFFALDTLEYVARQARSWLRPRAVAHHNWAFKSKRAWLTAEPLGVVALITPWNYPFAIPIGQIAPALAAGNAILFKPSELTPWTGDLIGELLANAGMPANVLQVLEGGAGVAATIIESGPDKVFFTGSVATGRKIAEACGRRLIPSVLELGGKDPMVVLADADLENAASAAVWGAFTNCGQACLSVERIYVEQGVAEKFLALCVEKARKLRVGKPEDAETDIGPMIRQRQMERVEKQLKDAVERGARILLGGVRAEVPGGNYFAPTIVADVDPSMLLMREETFGPVMAIQAVGDAQEAIRLSNDSEFGLAASVWTGNRKRGRQVAAQLRGGSVMINDVASYYGVTEAPHGGRGASGWGRVHSRLGFEEMVHLKYIDQERLPRLPKAWWYGYSEGLRDAADRSVEVLFAPGRSARWSALWKGKGSLRTLFRKRGR